MKKAPQLRLERRTYILAYHSVLLQPIQKYCCGPDYIITISYDLGWRYITQSKSELL